MAKGNKRLRKKREKERLRKEVVTQQKIEPKKAKNVSFSILQSIAKEIEKEQQERQKKEKRYEYNKEYRKKRRYEVQTFLESMDIDPAKFPVSMRDKIKLKDIRNGNFNSDTYPEFFKDVFDYEKRYKLKDGEKMYFAFRDYAGEMCFGEELERADKLSNKQLLEKVNELARTPKTYNKTEYRESKGARGGSSGSAGDYKFLCAKQIVIADEQKDVYNRNRRKRTKLVPKGNYKGFQVLKNADNGRTTFDTVTPRWLLKLATVIMSNVTEDDRESFYNNFYEAVEKHIPEMAVMMVRPEKKRK